MKIRRATEDDVPAMLALHRQAVRRTAAAFYDTEVIDAWSSSSEPENRPATIERMSRNLTSGEVIGFVVETEDAICGFGEFLPSKSMLGAIYVHPDHGRKGVGGMLMEALEHTAREHGISELHMDASLNAEIFYNQHGFEALEYGQHTLRDGLKMACVKMRKKLTA